MEPEIGLKVAHLLPRLLDMNACGYGFCTLLLRPEKEKKRSDPFRCHRYPYLWCLFSKTLCQHEVGMLIVELVSIANVRRNVVSISE